MPNCIPSNSPRKLNNKMGDCCMHVGDVADDVLPIETGHRLIYFHSVVECYVANKLIEKNNN